MVAVSAHGICTQPWQPLPWLFVSGASLAPKSTERAEIWAMPPPEPIGEYWIWSALYIVAHWATAGATSDEPAPFRVPVDRLLAAPALVTASAPRSAAAARASAIRTSLPFLGMSFCLLLRGSRARYDRSCGGWDNPALRGGDEVVTGAGAGSAAT